MRVLHVLSEKTDTSAAGRAINALRAHGAEQALAAAPVASAALDLDLLNELEVTAFRFKRHLFRSRRLRLARIIRSTAPDLIQYWCEDSATAAPAQWRARSVLWVDDAQKSPTRATCEWRVASSRTSYEQLLASGAPASRTEAIYNFTEAQADCPAVDRTAYATPEDVPLTLSVGALDDDAGFDTLIDAVRRVEGQHLWIVGSGPLHAALHAQMRASGLHDRVRFLPGDTPLAGLFKTANFYVSVRRSDGFDPAIAEAFAYGVPVISTAAAAPGEEVRHGENGLITPRNQDEPLADRLTALQMERDFAARLIAGGRATHAEYFSQDAFLTAYLRLANKIIAYAGPFQR